MEDKFKLHLGDSYELIKQIPTASVDLILTDPPYNLSPYSTGNIEFTWRKDLNNDLAEWDKVEFKPADWVDEFKRILKPIKVLGHIIKIASNKGDMIFDPFMGVGSTGIAALNLGRKFTGIEIDEKYFKAAEKRLQNAASELQLF